MHDPLRRQIKAAQTAINMSQEDYKAMLMRVTGKHSSTDLSRTQIYAVLDEFKRLGWKPNAKNGRLIKTIQFLWMRLGEENCLETPTKKAMEAFCNKHVETRTFYSAPRGQLQHLVEVLKKWCERENISTGSIK